MGTTEVVTRIRSIRFEAGLRQGVRIRPKIHIGLDKTWDGRPRMAEFRIRGLPWVPSRMQTEHDPIASESEVASDHRCGGS